MNQGLIDRICEAGDARLREKLVGMNEEQLLRLASDIENPLGEYAFRLKDTVRRGARMPEEVTVSRARA